MRDAPSLIRYAISIGITIGWDEHGAAFAKITNPRSARQRRVFREMMESMEAGDVLLGWYYPGNFEAMQ